MGQPQFKQKTVSGQHHVFDELHRRRDRGRCQQADQSRRKKHPGGAGPVSYTHLDVYKRQGQTDALMEVCIPPLTLRRLDDVEQRLKDVIFKQTEAKSRTCLLYTSRCV